MDQQKKEPQRFNSKLTKFNSSTYVLVPFEELEFLGLEEGDRVEVWIRKREAPQNVR